jgi:general secretion pathway protein I
MVFGSFIVLAGNTVRTTDYLMKTALATVVANNAVNEAVEVGRSFTGKKEEVLNLQFTVNQDFEDLMGFRVLKISVGTEDLGELIEVYEAR